MEISKRIENGICEVVLSGKFTFSDNHNFRTVIDEIKVDKLSKIVFFMDNVEFVDSAALGMLLLARDEAERRNIALSIAGVQGQVKKMFQIARFETLFSIQ
jgi:anti-anti-sigma factor